MTTPTTQLLINAAEQFRAAFQDGNAGTPKMLEYFDSVFEEALAATPAAEAQPVLSDERIAEIADQYNTGRAQGDYDFARAIERAALSALREELAAVPQQPDVAKIMDDCLSYAGLSCLGTIKTAHPRTWNDPEEFAHIAWKAMAKAVRHAVQLTAREVKSPVWPYVASDAGTSNEQPKEPK